MYGRAAGLDEELLNAFREKKAGALARQFCEFVDALAKAPPGSFKKVRSRLQHMVNQMKGRARTPLDVAALKLTEAALEMVWAKMGGRPKVTVTVHRDGEDE